MPRIALFLSLVSLVLVVYAIGVAVISSITGNCGTDCVSFATGLATTAALLSMFSLFIKIGEEVWRRTS